MTCKPKLLVFDLDYTLWPFWVDCHVEPPFSKDNKGNVVDLHGARVKRYPEVSEVLKQLKDEGYLLGIASRTTEIKGAHQLINLFGWDDYFSYKEIFPGCKVQHFNNIKRSSNVDFKDMIFFDDEHRNIADLTNHGVFSVLIKNGVDKNVVKTALANYAEVYILK